MTDGCCLLVDQWDGNDIAVIGVVAPLVGIGGVALAWCRAWRRDRLRRLLQTAAPTNLGAAVADDSPARASFAGRRLALVENFLAAEDWVALREEAVVNLPHAERTYIPTHKKSGTICYERILRDLPRCAGVYHSPSFRTRLSGIVGAPLLPTPVGDQSSLSLLCYTEAGDHINWHYDHNFYRGRHFTVLLGLVDHSSTGGPSASRLTCRLADGEQSFETPGNALIIFEGAKVRHKVTPAAEGDTRVMLSMTYATDPRISSAKEFLRRCKDTAFFGLRALWD